MIKLVYAISRRPDLSSAAFHATWLNDHGPLVAELADALRLRKYVQSHRVEHPANEAMRAARGMLPPIDGITEVWWDSLDDLQAAYASPAGIKAGRRLAEDEARFIDFAESQVFLTQEHVIFDHGPQTAGDPVKVTYLLARRPDLSQGECHATWLNDHGPLVASFADRLLMRRYVQSHSIAPEMNAAFQASKGYRPPLDGITEVWMDSLDDLERGGETDDQRAASMALVEDEKRFVDMARSRCFLTREHLIFDHSL